MKYLLLILLFISCTHPGTNHGIRLDTFSKAIYYTQDLHGRRQGPYMDSAIYVMASHWVFKDSVAETGGHWRTDTLRYARIADDTLRDALHHPLLDSQGHPRWHYGYYILADSLIQPVTIWRR